MLERWSRWWGRAAAPAGDHRWIVADVETSGLDPHSDRLLAIAAVALRFDTDAAGRRRPQLVLGDSFEVLLRQSEEAVRVPDEANILTHHIGVGAQRLGAEPAEALLQWEAYVAGAPLVAFHSSFDSTVIDRACRQWLHRRGPGPWLDLEPVCAVLHDQARRQPLDHWLQRYAVPCLQRHQAAADAMATAQLLMRLWPQVLKRGDGSWQALVQLASLHRWMPGRE
jgi:DNA polymerase-3 subunit epsilon